jgi:hypothetical protein
MTVNRIDRLCSVYDLARAEADAAIYVCSDADTGAAERIAADAALKAAIAKEDAAIATLLSSEPETLEEIRRMAATVLADELLAAVHDCNSKLLIPFVTMLANMKPSLRT